MNAYFDGKSYVPMSVPYFRRFGYGKKKGAAFWGAYSTYNAYAKHFNEFTQYGKPKAYKGHANNAEYFWEIVNNEGGETEIGEKCTYSIRPAWAPRDYSISVSVNGIVKKAITDSTG